MSIFFFSFMLDIFLLTEIFTVFIKKQNAISIIHKTTRTIKHSNDEKPSLFFLQRLFVYLKPACVRRHISITIRIAASRSFGFSA